MKNTIIKALEKSYTYTTYRATIATLLAEGKSTGNTQTEDLLHYSQLNETRMNRLEKTIEITAEITQKLQNLDKKYSWLVLAEGWCGDAAQLLPIMHKMAELSENINFRIVLRDENEALMNEFLTNGSKSIPKLIILDEETLEVLASWGPRPEPARKLIADYKEKNGVVDEPIKIELQKWYLHNKGITTQNEILELMKEKVLI